MPQLRSCCEGSQWCRARVVDVWWGSADGVVLEWPSFYAGGAVLLRESSDRTVRELSLCFATVTGGLVWCETPHNLRIGLQQRYMKSKWLNLDVKQVQRETVAGKSAIGGEELVMCKMAEIIFAMKQQDNFEFNKNSRMLLESRYDVEVAVVWVWRL